jgi:hypothetical protein
LARWNKTAGTSSELGIFRQELLEVGHPLLLIGQHIGAELFVFHRILGVDQAIGCVGTQLVTVLDDRLERLLALRIEAGAEGGDQVVDHLPVVAELFFGAFRSLRQGA